MKNDTPEKQLTELCSQLIHERAIWNHINENGCNDPFWPDGCNMKQQARVERLKQQGDKLSLKKTKFVDDGQLEFG